MYHVHLTIVCVLQAETEVVVKSGNVNVVDKMIVSGYDVKVGQNSIFRSVIYHFHLFYSHFAICLPHPFVST